MARTVAPLLSFEAGGQIAKTQVYSKWKGRPYVRRYTVPANPRTADQTETRDTFRWLNSVWSYMPSVAQLAWDAYADTSRFTNRNGWIKQNLSALRSASDLTDFLFSPAANGGTPATSVVGTPGSGQISIAIVAPQLPSGWTIAQAIGAAIRNQDPQSGALYTVTAGFDATSTYAVVLTGLTASQEYVIGGWFQYLKPDGSFAYGRAVMNTATPS